MSTKPLTKQEKIINNISAKDKAKLRKLELLEAIKKLDEFIAILDKEIAYLKE